MEMTKIWKKLMEKSIISICHFEILIGQILSSTQVHVMGLYLLTNAKKKKKNQVPQPFSQVAPGLWNVFTLQVHENHSF